MYSRPRYIYHILKTFPLLCILGLKREDFKSLFNIPVRSLLPSSRPKSLCLARSSKSPGVSGGAGGDRFDSNRTMKRTWSNCFQAGVNLGPLLSPPSYFKHNEAGQFKKLWMSRQWLCEYIGERFGEGERERNNEGGRGKRAREQR